MKRKQRSRRERIRSVAGWLLALCCLMGCSSDGRPQKSAAICGSKEVSPELFSYFYWMEYEQYVDEWRDVLQAEDSPMRFDPYHALADQTRFTDGRTWQQFFIDRAMDTLHRYLALLNGAERDESYTISQDKLSLIESARSGLERQAELGGYENADALLQKLFFEDADAEGYQAYYDVYVRANDYYDYLRDQLEVSDETVVQMYYQNRDAYAEQGISDEDDASMVEFRHILVRPQQEEGQTAESAWEEAKKQAEAVLKDFENTDGSVSSFSQLALVFSEDAASYLQGGLYLHVYPGEFDQALDQWLFDETRQEGDLEVLRSDQGWHVVWYLGQEGLARWYYQAAVDFASQLMEQKLAELQEQYPLEQHQEAIRLTDLPTA